MRNKARASMKSGQEQLKHAITKQSRRHQEFEQDRGSFLRHTVFAGMLGLLFIVPVVVAAYCGNWLDLRQSGYSTGWTINLILLGIAFGSANVFLFIKEKYK